MTERIEVGYAVWGALAVLVTIPKVVAAFGREWVPWPGFARTVVYLQERIPWGALLFMALFAILVVHIVFHPWPDLD